MSWGPASHIGGRVSAGAGTATIKRLATAGCDGLIRVYRSNAGVDGRETWALESTLSRQHKDWARDVAWSPGSGLSVNMLASASDDGLVVIWRQGTPGGEWTAEPLPAFPAPVWRVSWSVTGNLLAVSCGDSSVTLWKESVSGGWQQISSVPEAAATPSAAATAAPAAAQPAAARGYAY